MAFAGAIGAMVFALVAAGTALAEAKRPLFCVLVPHFKDEYWLSVGYGLEREADRQGVELLFFEAGGYRSQERQIAQLLDCRTRGVDAILLGTVTSDHPDLLAAVADVSRQVPVFGLVNELHAPQLSASIGVDWDEMGHVLGRFLAARHPANSPPKQALLISGPPESGWIGPLENGLRRGLAGSSLHLVAVFGADTGLRQQLARVEEALEAFPDSDYLIGSAPAVEAAIGLLEQHAARARPVLLSTYISHTVKRGLLNGKILAAPFDDPVEQGEMAIKAAVGGLPPDQAAGFIGPEIILLTQARANVQKAVLSPSDYFPKID